MAVRRDGTWYKKYIYDSAYSIFEFHLKNCNKYKIWYESNNFTSPSLIKDYQDVPFIPSSTFKHTNLVSIKNSKKIQSSGTTSNAKSTIFIDKATSQNQTKSLSKILSAILKNKRSSLE